MLQDLYNIAKKNDTDIVKSAYYEFKDDNNTVTKNQLESRV